jgi:hypothetical protein
MRERDGWIRYLRRARYLLVSFLVTESWVGIQGIPKGGIIQGREIYEKSKEDKIQKRKDTGSRI